MATKFVKNYEELEVYERAIDLAMEIFEVTESFPKCDGTVGSEVRIFNGTVGGDVEPA